MLMGMPAIVPGPPVPASLCVVDRVGLEGEGYVHPSSSARRRPSKARTALRLLDPFTAMNPNLR